MNGRVLLKRILIVLFALTIFGLLVEIIFYAGMLNERAKWKPQLDIYSKPQEDSEWVEIDL